ncbi:MAG TPA: hypothetical protein VLB80_00625, partial [Candidatus Babeliales bacterium]|nr:hypothetical protein [Candidatus Babeliales bacterium]
MNKQFIFILSVVVITNFPCSAMNYIRQSLIEFNLVSVTNQEKLLAKTQTLCKAITNCENTIAPLQKQLLTISRNTTLKDDERRTRRAVLIGNIDTSLSTLHDPVRDLVLLYKNVSSNKESSMRSSMIATYFNHTASSSGDNDLLETLKNFNEGVKNLGSRSTSSVVTDFTQSNFDKDDEKETNPIVMYYYWGDSKKISKPSESFNNKGLDSMHSQKGYAEYIRDCFFVSNTKNQFIQCVDDVNRSIAVIELILTNYKKNKPTSISQEFENNYTKILQTHCYALNISIQNILQFLAKVSDREKYSLRLKKITDIYQFGTISNMISDRKFNDIGECLIKLKKVLVEICQESIQPDSNELLQSTILLQVSEQQQSEWPK